MDVGQKKRHLPVAAGHKSGAQNVRAILQVCKDIGVSQLTLFAFSSENWRRPALEVKALMSLFSDYLDHHIESLNEKGVRLNFIGARDKFAASLLKKIVHAEQKTAENSAFTLNLAVDYGGQWDICNAMKMIAKEVEVGHLKVSDIDEQLVEQYLSLSGESYPDLMIRTSGEHRISNFLLWQLAYSEFYFTDVLWPDFKEADLLEAVDCFNQRERRYGGREK